MRIHKRSLAGAVLALALATMGACASDPLPVAIGEAALPSMEVAVVTVDSPYCLGITGLPGGVDEVTLGSNHSRQRVENILCLADGRQVPCAPEGDVWRAELDEPGRAIAPVPGAGTRREVIRLLERDGRPEGAIPFSRMRSLDGPGAPFSPGRVGEPPLEAAGSPEGCDYVLLENDSDARFPLRFTPTGRPLHMRIALCPERPAYVIHPMVVVNETMVAEIDGFHPFLAQPGRTYVLPVPGALVTPGVRLRAAVSRVTSIPNMYAGHWITHPVTVIVPGDAQTEDDFWASQPEPRHYGDVAGGGR